MMLQKTQRSLRPNGQNQSLLVLWKMSLEKCLKDISDNGHLSVSRGELPVVAHGEKTDLSLKRCTCIASGYISQLPVSPV